MTKYTWKTSYPMIVLCFGIIFTTCLQGQVTDEDGDWANHHETLQNTPEAALMVRTGDIDNLGFGWPANFNPFSGNSTPAHGYPWTADTTDPAGTDRIMVITSYTGNPPSGQDGYTTYTSRPENSVRPIRLTYSLDGINLNSAILQIFVDDFQAGLWKASYQVTLNNVRVNFMETIINGLMQTGPVGKLISVEIPDDYLYLIEKGTLDVEFDDFTTGAGDGYAIDFVKLLINPTSIAQVGSINGTVYDQSTNQPIDGVQVVANGIAADTTDTNGNYTLNNVLAGIVNIQTFKVGYGSKITATELTAGSAKTVNFYLQSPAPAVTAVKPADSTFNVSFDVQISVVFDQKMDTLTFNSANFILSATDFSVGGNFIRSDSILTFVPASPLTDDTDYHVVLTTGIKSSTGINLAGNFVWYFSTGMPASVEEHPSVMPGNTILEQNYPNPFNPETVISWRLAAGSHVELTVYNLLGEKVATPVSERMNPGRHTYTFKAGDLTSGVYYYQLVAGVYREVRKMILLR